MRHRFRAVGLITIGLLVVVFLSIGVARMMAQSGLNSPLELADTIRVDEPEPAVRTHLERARAMLAEQQWDEAIETLRQVMGNHGERLLRLDAQRFVTVREFCHMRLVELPAEGLRLYRGRVDASAKRWFDEGVARRDEKQLRRVVDELFAGSYADDALLVLGDMALEQGRCNQARWCWERISPKLRTWDGLPLWVAIRSGETQPDDPPKPASDATPRALWLAYPDTDLNLADVRARLVLVSILEGATERAAIELQAFEQLHPNTTGRLAGRDAPYIETLTTLLAGSQQWPRPENPDLAITFSGQPSRNWIAPTTWSFRAPAWESPILLGDPLQADMTISRSFGLPEIRVAESAQALLSHHPLVVDNLVVWHDAERVYAFDLKTGKPAWLRAEPKQFKPGQIYGPRLEKGTPGDATLYSRTLGVPRHTLSVYGKQVFARLGSQATSWPNESAPDRAGSIIGLDLARQGLLTCEIKPDSERWSFEGPPLFDGAYLYVAMRYNDARPQSHVACYEPQANGTATLRWRRLICAAESPGRGSVEEITHNLLTMIEGRLYLNTNLGAVACLTADDGRLQWLTTYRRARRTDPSAHYFRDLNPCVYERGTLFVAPSDCPSVLAIDAVTGQLRWASPSRLSDIVHLLGVAHGQLIAGGKQLWWLDAETGKVVQHFPDNLTQSLGYGRGLLVGDSVVWPTREFLYVFDQQQKSSARLSGNASSMPRASREPIRWSEHAAGLSGGNIVAAGEYVLVATADKLWAFGPKIEKITPLPLGEEARNER